MRTERSPQGCALHVDDIELRALYHGLEFMLINMCDATNKAAFIEEHGQAMYDTAYTQLRTLMAELGAA